MEHTVDLDSVIDYGRFYSGYLRDAKASGAAGDHSCKCPFHADSTASFSFNTKTGKWKCFAGCGAGNAVSFLARYKRIDTKQAYAELVETYAPDATKANGKTNQHQRLPYTLAEYALAKRLPESFLVELGLTNNKTKTAVAIPYRDEHGIVARTKYRNHPSSVVRFTWSKGDALMLYGLDRLDDARRAQRVALCEGESDTQTLWFHDLPAVGVPGAEAPKPELLRPLLAIPNIIVLIDADKPKGGSAPAGEIFFGKVCTALRDLGYQGTVRRASAHDVADDCKDPSDVHIKHPEDSHALLAAMLDGAKTVDIHEAARVAQVAAISGLTDPPLPGMQVPDGFTISNDGISRSHNGRVYIASRTPVIITAVLHDDEGERLELRYRYGNTWRTTRAARSDVASARSIVKLADAGISVTSETAPHLVAWLAEFQYVNADILASYRRIRRYGWQADGTHFHGQDLAGSDTIFDPVNGAQTLKQRGTLAGWRAMVGDIIQTQPLALFVTCCGLAAPLLELTGQRSFICYTWGDSRGGKTAALYAALSVWGPPEDMVTSFNATNFALEKTATHYCDLPIGLNERQLARGKDSQAQVEQIMYFLGENKGRARGSKDGSLQRVETWRTVVLCNGEQSLTSDTTMTGVSTRALELFGRPFDSERAASAIYDGVQVCYGTAASVYMDAVCNARERLSEAHRALRDALRTKYPDYAASNVAAVALAMLAWRIAAGPVFGLDPVEDADIIRDMESAMLTQVFGSLRSVSEANVDTAALEYVWDWVMANKDHFAGEERMERYGCVEMVTDPYEPAHQDPDWDVVYVIPTTLDKALRDRGFDPRKTRNAMIEAGIIQQTAGKRSDRKSGSRTYSSISKRIDGAVMRVIRLDFGAWRDAQGLLTEDELSKKGGTERGSGERGRGERGNEERSASRDARGMAILDGIDDLPEEWK